MCFHYDDENPQREKRHANIVSSLKDRGTEVQELIFTESRAARSIHDNIAQLERVLSDTQDKLIVLDISVFTKRHLLMMLRWLDDANRWDRLIVVYTQPEEYDVSEFIPLSFGLRSFEQVPGFSACPDLSRPVHLVLFLGYEGDRALAAYEHVQPMETTIMLTHPPFKSEWIGRTEALNSDLLSLVRNSSLRRIDGIDPSPSTEALEEIFHDRTTRSEFAKIVCPIGTKPQTLGIYSYVRTSPDPPAVVYASPLRHNHRFFSHGVGASWILKKP